MGQQDQGLAIRVPAFDHNGSKVPLTPSLSKGWRDIMAGDSSDRRTDGITIGSSSERATVKQRSPFDRLRMSGKSSSYSLLLGPAGACCADHCYCRPSAKTRDLMTTGTAPEPGISEPTSMKSNSRRSMPSMETTGFRTPISSFR